MMSENLPKAATTRQYMELGVIPEWLGNSLQNECQYCHCPIINSLNLRQRWCPNPYCYGHMHVKADELCKSLGVKNIGPKTCLALLRQHKMKSHFEILPYILSHRPVVRLWQIADMAGIQGYGKVYWEKTLAPVKSFQDFFDNYAPIPDDIKAYKSQLMEAEKYFEVKPPLSNRAITIMINGSVTGYSNRDMFIEKCNEIVGQYLRIKTSKSINADYCITQNPFSEDEKVRMARENGIPILSPQEFIQELTQRVVELIKG